MTPEQKRIAIAEACGWYQEYVRLAGDLGWTEEFTWKWKHPKHFGEYDNTTDYLNDLNAMHEAEKVLTNEQLWKYYHALSDVGFGGNNHWKRFNATAAQRAEAFLKAKGIWPCK